MWGIPGLICLWALAELAFAVLLLCRTPRPLRVWFLLIGAVSKVAIPIVIIRHVVPTQDSFEDGAGLGAIALVFGTFLRLGGPIAVATLGLALFLIPITWEPRDGPHDTPAA